MRRAGFSATTRQGIKNTSSPAGNVGERARRRQLPLNAAFDQGGRRRRPGSSTAAAASVAPIARAPASAPNRNITEKESGAAGDITIVRPAAAAPPRRPEQVEMRRAGFSATTRQGIKNTSSPAGNVGERARRRQLPLNAAFDQGGRRRRPGSSTAAAASVAPIARAPASAPNRNITEKESGPPATSPSCGQQPLHRPGGPSRSRCAAPDSRPPPAKG